VVKGQGDGYLVVFPSLELVTEEIAGVLADSTKFSFIEDDPAELEEGLPGEHLLWLVEAA